MEGGKVAVLNASELMIEAKISNWLFHVRSKTKQPSIESNATWQVADSLSVGDFSAGLSVCLESATIESANRCDSGGIWRNKSSGMMIVLQLKIPEWKEERHNNKKRKK